MEADSPAKEVVLPVKVAVETGIPGDQSLAVYCVPLGLVFVDHATVTELLLTAVKARFATGMAKV